MNILYNYKRTLLIVPIVLAVIITMPVLLKDASADDPDWSFMINVSGSVMAVVADDRSDGFVYVAGNYFAGGWRIEKRRKSDGSLALPAWDTPIIGSSMPYAMVFDEGYLYVCGKIMNRWAIKKIRCSDMSDVGSVEISISGFENVAASSLVISGDSLYVVGNCYNSVITSPLDTLIRVERRDKDNITVLENTPLEINSILDYYGFHNASITADDGTGGFIYIACAIRPNAAIASYNILIQKRRKDNLSVLAAQNSESGGHIGAGDLVSDNDYLYLCCQPNWTIQKRNKSNLNHAVPAVSFDIGPGSDYALGIAADSTGVYTCGTWDPWFVGSQTQFRFDWRRRSDLFMEWEELEPAKPPCGFENATAIDTDNNYIYIGGTVQYGQYHWWLQRYKKRLAFVDSGLRVWHNGKAVKIAAHPEDDLDDHPLRLFRKNASGVDKVWSISLVPPGDPAESGVRVWVEDSSGVTRAYGLRRYE